MKTLILLVAMLTLTHAVVAQTYDRAKIWDTEINAIADFDLRQTPPKNAVLFVGSSSFRLWKTLRQDFPKLDVINRAFGGSRIEDVNFYFPRIAAPYDAKTVVLYAGENDINDGVSPQRVLADFRTFRSLVRKSFPKAKLVYVSMKPSPSRWKLADKFREANKLIKDEIALDKKAVFVDMWPMMLDAKGEPRPELFVADMLHMNAKGYAIWQAELSKHLK